MSKKIIEVDYLARVEGEGALFIRIDNDRVEDIKLKIFEPPRFFEALLRGREFSEAPDITARICGICPVAYLNGAAHAMEDACGIVVSGQLRELRRMIYCGEWIESHILHMFMLHAPDFLGYPDVMSMAKDHPEIVNKALRIKKIGNRIMRLIGGREIHPINVKVGGFYSVPDRNELETLREDLEWGLQAAIEAVEFVAGLPMKDFEIDYRFVALRHPDEYPFNEGRLVSSTGIDVPISQYDDILVEEHVAHSTALHSHLKDTGDSVLVGPLARYALNYDKLSPKARNCAEKAGLGSVCKNPFKSIIVRGVEVVFAFEEALRILDQYEQPQQACVEVNARQATGYGCTEAPRGICFHRYTIGDDGLIQDAKIVSPTAVNQKRIEEDLYHYVKPNLHLTDEQLKWDCEQAIRNYDPCISCSTHFLDLTVERR